MRISGFASGMDIDSMVKSLMESHKAPVTKLQKQVIAIEQKQEAYRTVSSAIVDFRNNKLATFNLSSALGAKKAEISGNTTAISATATSGNSAGTYDIKVKNLATSTRILGAVDVQGLNETGEFIASGKVIINNSEISYQAGDTLDSLISKINNDKEANVTMLYNKNDGMLSITSKTSGSGDIQLSQEFNSVFASARKEVQGLNESGEFVTSGVITINNTDIAYNAGETLAILINRVNSSVDANVIMSYDENKKVLNVASKSGAGNTVTLGNNFQNMFSSVELEKTLGQDARAEVNGVEVVSSKNQLSLNGVSIELKKVHEGSDSSSITITSDTDKILNTIKDFISSYNSVVELINGKLNEDKYRNYAPLTDEEKEGMTDKQIELWESKSKSGLLKNDSILSNLVSNMRTAVMTEVQSSNGKLHLNDLGITTGQWFEGGKLVIKDEAKLKEAIENNLDSVVSLFGLSGSSQSTNKATDVNTGLFQRLTSISMDGLVALSEKAGTSRTSSSTIGSFLETASLSLEKKSITNKIDLLNAKMVRLETQYYKQFTAMETAINRYNSQASSIASYSVI